MATRIQQQKVYSFKAVGELTRDKWVRADERFVILPVGISTPLELGEGDDGLFKMTTNNVETIIQNFRTLLTTDHGERLGLYDYGANLSELAFELATDRGVGEAVTRIKKAVAKYMPYVTCNTFTPLTIHFDNKEVAKVGYTINYGIPKLGVTSRNMQVIIYTAG